METPNTTPAPAPNPGGPATTLAPNPPPIEQLKALAEVVQGAVPEWPTCLMQCEKQVEGNQEVVITGCGHMICSDACLKKLQEQYSGNEENIKCPLCALQLEESALKNKMMIKEAFPFKVSKAKVTPICGHCIFNNEAISYCGDCSSYLCKKCDALHPNIRLMKAHKVTRYLSGRKVFELDRMVTETSICKGHADEPEPPTADAVTHNCKGCKLRTCKFCTQKDRKEKHAVVDVRRPRLKHEMAEFLAIAYDSLTTLNRAQIIKMRNYWNQILSQLGREFSVLSENASNQYFEQLEGVFDLFQTVSKELEQKINDLQVKQEQIKRYIKVAKCVYDEGDDQSILQFNSLMSPLAAKLTETTNTLKDYDKVTIPLHKFQTATTKSTYVALFMKEFAQAHHVNPEPRSAFSLALDGSVAESARLTDGHRVDKTVEKLRQTTKDLQEKRNKEGKEKAVKKAADEEAARKKAEEEAVKKAAEEEAQKQMNGGLIQGKKGENGKLTNYKREGKRKMGYGGNRRSKKQKTGGRPKSPSMPKLKREAPFGRPV